MKKIYLFLTVCLLGVFFSGISFADPFNLNRPLVLGSSGEPSLQAIFNSTYLSGSSGPIDAFNGQSNVGLWQEAENDVDTYLITRYAADSGRLGIYSAATGAAVLLPFVSNQSSFNIYSDGSLVVNGTTYANFGTTFGFFWEDTSVANISYTEDSKNTDGYGVAGNIKALSYLVGDGYKMNLGYDTLTGKGNNDWILAFEDRSFSSGGDRDFNDAIFWVEDMQPVPEPVSMLLFGTGLVGAGGYLRRRFKK